MQVRQGKDQKDRTVYLPHEAIAIVERWITVKPQLELVAIAACGCGVTLYFHRDGSTEISPLNCLQQQILKLMGFGESIYALPCLVPE